MLSSAAFLLAACGTEVGSEEWCEELRDKVLGEWTAEEVNGFANYCIGRNRE